jgi:hypothetical protein
MKVGAARVDITPPLGVALTGFSLLGTHRYARGVCGRLYANALALEDDDGQEYMLVSVDLHASTRYLMWRVVENRAGISRDRILMGATHTHCAPGHIYGSKFYDLTAAPGPLLGSHTFQALADLVAERIAVAISRAREQRTEAVLRFKAVPIWGSTWQRSTEAFAANFVDLEKVRGGKGDARVDGKIADELARFLQGPTGKDHRRLAILSSQLGQLDGVAADDVKSPRRYAVVPVLDVLAAHAVEDNELIGALAVLHATPTLMGQAKVFSSDVAGEACRMVIRELGKDVPVGIMGGVHGDTNVLPPDETVDEVRAILFPRGRASTDSDGFTVRAEIPEHHIALRRLGRRGAEPLARAILDGIRTGRTLPGTTKIRFAFAEADIKSSTAVDREYLDADVARVGQDQPPHGRTFGLEFARRRLAFSDVPTIGFGVPAGSNLNRRPTGRRDDSDQDAKRFLGALVGDKYGEGTRDEHLVDEGPPPPPRDKPGFYVAWAKKFGVDVAPQQAQQLHAHAPKKGVSLFPGGTPNLLPIRALRLDAGNGGGDYVFLSVPGEPSTGTFWRLLQLLRAEEDGRDAPPLDNDDRLVVVAPSGEYCGYFCSPREYLRQQYESAGQWWGRDSGVWLENQLLELARNTAAPIGAAPPPLSPEPRFDQGIDATSLGHDLPNWDRPIYSVVRPGRLWARRDGPTQLVVWGYAEVDLPAPQPAQPLGTLRQPLLRFVDAETREPLKYGAIEATEATVGAWVELHVHQGVPRLEFVAVLDRADDWPAELRLYVEACWAAFPRQTNAVEFKKLDP